MMKMLLVDESKKVFPTIQSLFEKEFDITHLEPDLLKEKMSTKDEAPDFTLFVSMGNIQDTYLKMKEMRQCWPKAVTILILPTISSQKELGNIVIPVHRIIFKPCSKQLVMMAVEDFRDLLSDSLEPRQDEMILCCLLEFIGANMPLLYVSYNRVMPLIMNLCKKVGYDWRPVKKVFALYLLMLSRLDEDMLNGMMSGEKRSPSLLKKVYEHVAKMVDLLRMDEATQDIADDLKYVLKKFDGSGFPADDIKEMDIPASSRIIRLLFDYHHLLQQGKSTGEALFVLDQRSKWYDGVLLHAFIDILGDAGKNRIRTVYPLGLTTGMEIAEDVYGVIDAKKRKILSCGEILTEETIDYLQRHSEDILDITEPIKICDALL